VSRDATWRLAIAVILLVLLPMVSFHRWRAAATGEELDRRQEGQLMFAALRIASALFWIALFAYLFNPSWLAWSAVPMPPWSRAIGVGGAIAGDALLAWTLSALGRNLTDTVVTRSAHTLVITGPYRWVRHPFYLSMGILVLALSIVAANWFLLVMGSLLLAMLAGRTRREEANLMLRFAEGYPAYRQRVGRFLPKLW
jgi:protein-S-isoprenylcysteine O-methyltransferase Ste14